MASGRLQGCQYGHDLVGVENLRQRYALRLNSLGVLLLSFLPPALQQCSNLRALLFADV